MSKFFTLLTFLILLFSTNLFGQSFYPEFPDSNARWINSSANYCMNEEDTLINEILYSKLDTCEGGYKGALRSDSERVYFVPRDSISEYLTYDFSALPGDTIENVYFEPFFQEGGQLCDVLVLNLWSMGLYVSLLNFDGFSASEGLWIRNVGSESGIFRPHWDGIAEGEFYYLACFSSSDTIYHPIESYGPGQCALDLSIEKHSTEEFNLYPNPTSGEVTLDFPPGLKPQEIEVRNAMGRVVQSDCAIHGSTIKIDLSHLSSGMYFLNLRFEGEVISKKIIKN